MSSTDRLKKDTNQLRPPQNIFIMRTHLLNRITPKKKIIKILNKFILVTIPE